MTTANVNICKTSPETLVKDLRRILGESDFSGWDIKAPTYIKMNGNYDRHYPGSNTSPWFMDALLTALRTKGFEQLTVVEGNLPYFTADQMIRRTGMMDILKQHSVPFINYESMERDENEIPRMLLDAQVINVPVPHGHGFAVISCAVKNLFGLLPNPRRRFHRTLSDTILRLAEKVHPFTVVDATVGLVGPSTRRGKPIRMDLILAGWDPDEPVPAFMYRPPDAGKLPVIIFAHGLNCSKDEFAARLPLLAEAGFLVFAIDDYLHGERREPSVFPDKSADLKASQAIWVHQTCVSHTGRDMSSIMDHLGDWPGADPSRVGVAGMSMGAVTALVAAARDRRIAAAVSLCGATDSWWDVTKTPPGPEQDAMRQSYSPRLRQLVNSLDPMQHLATYPPKAVLLLSGKRDHFIDYRSVETFVERLRAVYGADRDKVGFFLEPEIGHSVTDLMWSRMIEWFVRYVRGEKKTGMS